MEFKKERITMTWIFIESITTSLLHYICITKQFQIQTVLQIQTVSNPNSFKPHSFKTTQFQNHIKAKPHSFKTIQFLKTIQFQIQTVNIVII